MDEGMDEGMGSIDVGAAGRAALRSASRVVVKIGSAVLTNSSATLDRGYLHDLAAAIARDASERAGRRVIVVSSAAVAAGLGRLGLRERPSDLGVLQAAAAAGQPELMHAWRDAMGVRGRAVAQILLSRSDFDARDRFLNIRNCVHALLERGVMPIVNENDSVATEEMSLGDNDVLAAKLAVAVRAEALVILTSAAGVLDASGSVVGVASGAAGLVSLVRPTATAQGRGGMGTKVEAARIAGAAGLPTVIAPGRPADLLGRVLGGESVGTLVLPMGSGGRGGVGGVGGRRQWIELAATPLGTLEIDAGAVAAIRERGASLLAKGITGVGGSFGVGDVVAIRGPGREGVPGVVLARGLSNMDASEVRRVMGHPSSALAGLLGRRTHEEVVHRDNMVLV